MTTVLQRILIIPAVLLALPVAVVITPIALVIAVALDTISGLRRLPLGRLWLFFVAALAIEWYALAARMTILVGRALRVYRRRPRVMTVWAGALLASARRLLGIRFVLPDPLHLPPGRLLLLSRHSSMVDAIIPAWLVNGPLDRPVHYVLKRELSWVPSINLFVPVLGNYFVRRGADTDTELRQIATLAEEAIPESVLVIFPEGTYGTPANKARIRESLERRGDTDAVALDDRLEHLLPPKPAGTLTLLHHRPDADVLVFAHAGLEPLGEFTSFRRTLPLDEPVVLHWWHTPRAEIPDDDADAERWLQEAWIRMDQWIGGLEGGSHRPTVGVRAQKS